ncbi:MAG TPA: signal peptide peptidase SppA [Solibacterales bacterium]|nr:signal peptide peptidase SppA [Bryobacterales bacterium]
MKKFLLGLVAGLFLAGMTVLILFLAMLKLGESRPAVADGSTLVLRLQGDIPEQPGMEAPFPGLGETGKLTMAEHYSLLRKAAVDNRVKAVLLLPRGMATGWAKLQELREAVTEFRKSGKPVYAWLRTPGMREYYLATAAEKIYFAPEEVLDIKGLRAELMFVKGTLDKIGVKMEIEHAGKYKDAGDMLTRTSASPETLEVMNSVLDSVYGHLLSTLAQGRKKQPEELRALLDQGPFLAAAAAKAGLVDGLLYEDQVESELARRTGQGELKKLGAKEYNRASVAGFEGKHRIALLVGQGAILRGAADSLSEDGIFSDSFIKQIRQVGKDASVKGVVVRIDSPGGDALASDDILRELKLLSKKKPTVISMSDVAASGGYYIAMTGDPVLAYANTFTGSIGVIYGKPMFRGLYDKIGVTKQLLTRGKNAAIDSDYEPMTEAGRLKLRETIDSIYDGFVKRVAEGRKQKYEAVNQLAQGRVWLGSQAQERKLVDELAGLTRAIELVKEKAKIPAQDRVRLVPFPGRKTIFEALFETSNASLAESATASVQKELGIPAPLWTQVRLWMQGGVMRVMPYSIDVR